MDRVEKALNKLKGKERNKIKKILVKINNGDFQQLDLKKLKNREDIFRVRKMNFRIIFYKRKNSINILSIERRKSKTYKK
jgi:mRNA-degrading endonuclease RelE of RelBE toxin-antitoxin system